MEATPYPALSQEGQRPTTLQHERLELQKLSSFSLCDVNVDFCILLYYKSGAFFGDCISIVYKMCMMFSWYVLLVFPSIFKCQVSHSALTTLAMCQLLMQWCVWLLQQKQIKINKVCLWTLIEHPFCLIEILSPWPAIRPGHCWSSKSFCSYLCFSWSKLSKNILVVSFLNLVFTYGTPPLFWSKYACFKKNLENHILHRIPRPPTLKESI